MSVTKALVVKLTARSETATEVGEFLSGALELANQEAGTVNWYALQTDETTFWIVDTFPSDTERTAHLEGPIAAALMENAERLLAGNFGIGLHFLPHLSKDIDNLSLNFLLAALDEAAVTPTSDDDVLFGGVAMWRRVADAIRLDIVGGRPLRGVEAWAWTSAGQLLGHTHGGARGTLFVCGPAGPARLDLEATLRPGPVSVLLHAEPDVPPALLGSPLAAGRLLAQVVERGVLRRASEIGQVHQLSLSETEIKSLDLTVPFGRCVDVALALGAEGVGAEVRLVVAATATEIAIGRGAHATSARVCALDAGSAENNLKTRAEFRIASGAGKALVATRMLSPVR
jgi:quinol monooxygenase YgiN